MADGLSEEQLAKIRKRDARVFGAPRVCDEDRRELLAELDRQRALWAKLERLLRAGWSVHAPLVKEEPWLLARPMKVVKQRGPGGGIDGATIADAVSAAPDPQQPGEGEKR